MIVRYIKDHVTLTVSLEEYEAMLFALQYSQGGAGFEKYEAIAKKILEGGN